MSDNVAHSRLGRMLDRTRPYASVWIMVALVGAIMFAETDRLIAEILTADGRVYSLSQVIGPLALTSTEAWVAWTGAAQNPAPLILIHTLADAAFFVGYGLLGWRLLRTVRWGRRLLGALIVSEIVEAVTLFTLAAVLANNAQWWPLAIVEGAVATLKWLITIGLVLFVALNTTLRTAIGAYAKRVVFALSAQRLSVVVVAILALIALVPGSGVFEQIADVERGWIHKHSVDIVAIVFSVFTLALIFGLLFAMGRLRAGQYFDRANGVDVWANRQALYYPWLVAAGTVVVVALTLIIARREDLVDLPVVATFAGLLTALVAASSFLRNRAKSALPTFAPRPVTFREADDVKRAGDLVAFILVSFAVLGLVRSFTAPVLISLYNSAFSDDVVFQQVLALLALIAGIVLSVPSLYLLRTAFRRLDERSQIRKASDSNRSLVAKALDPTTATPKSRILALFAIAPIVIAILWLGAFLVFPRPLSSFIGPIGTITAILGCWSVVLGAAILILESRPALEIFRLFRLRATPLLTLLVALPLVVSQLAGSPALHAVEASPAVDNGSRPKLSDAFSDWLTRTDGCSTTVESGGSTVRVRPLVLVAAEGGGIRAATWTVDVLDQFLGHGDCIANSVMMSSGVSGGAVGLTMFRGASNDPGASKPNTTALGSDGLSVAIAGMMVGDMVGSITGVRVPTSPGYGRPGDPTQWAWQDRTALMQADWQERATQLRPQFDLMPQDPTGYVILNSLDAISTCKVLVSQVDLNPTEKPDLTKSQGKGDRTTDCNGTDAELPGSIDLTDFLRNCPVSFDWATVATMSARFPFVSPAGRIAASNLAHVATNGKCSLESDLQLIDGGYTENSGLGTLSDIAPDLTQLIEDHNLAATADPAGVYVVPIVMFLHNAPGEDVTAPPSNVKPELLVPLLSKLTAPGLQTKASTWLTSLSQSMDDVCPGSDPSSDCEIAVAATRKTIPLGVVVVAPVTNPSIEVPLGWTLSDLSRDRLSREVQAQLTCTTEKVAAKTCQSSSAYGSLGDLFSVLP